MNSTTQQHEYNGRKIVISEGGHPQVQNVEIDGQPVGYVVFPTNSLEFAKNLIHSRETNP